VEKAVKRLTFTVRKALQMEAFSGCSTLTGGAGLDNEIRWVNILEILDDLRHIEEGDFLITTAYDFDFRDTEKQERLIELFAGSKLAALAVQTGHYIADIPHSLIRLAEEHGIPVIEIPPDTSFKSLTKALLGELVQRDAARQNEETLRQKGGLQDLVRQNRILIQKLLAGENAEGLRERLRLLHISPHADFYLILIGAGDTKDAQNKASSKQDSGERELMEQSLVQLLAQYNLPFLVGPQEMNLVVLLQPLDVVEEQTASLAGQLLHELSLLYPRLNFTAGMSRCHGRLEEIITALDEAGKALEAAELGLMGRDALVRYSRLGPYRLLLEVENLEVLQASITDTLGPLIKYDCRSGGALVTTLSVYLKHMNISSAAAELFIHRHTLRYRLKQIEDLTGLKLDETTHAFQFYLALMVYDYLKARDLA
jgi:DNA-binding PucR family transcriptional regulator